MNDTERGLYRKFAVKRRDGSSEMGGKHYRCNYFVLDLDHDPHAAAALAGYAVSCRDEYALLARDLQAIVDDKMPSDFTWHDAALQLGELLGRDGPPDYYSFTPDQWLGWARTEIMAPEAC